MAWASPACWMGTVAPMTGRTRPSAIIGHTAPTVAATMSALPIGPSTGRPRRAVPTTALASDSSSSESSSSSDSWGGASGNAVFAEATEQIQKDVSTGSALTTSMTQTGVFPVMVLQMAAIGEESGSLDHMLGKAAEFYEEEVDDMVKGLSSLIEPLIIVVLGTVIGGVVVAMYLPIFKLGAVV